LLSNAAMTSGVLVSIGKSSQPHGAM